MCVCVFVVLKCEKSAELQRPPRLPRETVVVFFREEDAKEVEARHMFHTEV